MQGGYLSKLLLLAAVIVAVYIALHAKAYLADQSFVQHYIDTHTSAPATPSR